MKRLKQAKEQFGAMRALRHIRPPRLTCKPGHTHDGACRSTYDEWRRFLEQCRAAGVAAIYTDDDGTFRGFATPLGYALLKRWRWLTDCEARGVNEEEAEREWLVRYERDKDALLQSEREREEAVQRALHERDKADAFAHLDEILG